MQNLESFVEDYNQKLEPVLKAFFDDQIKKVSGISPVAVNQLKDLKDFMEGGKKLRGAEVLLGYKMFGGENEKEVLKSALAMEIVHSALLIQDDVMDQDELRRGKTTIHKKYSKDFDLHYGESMAINMGDAGFFMAFKLLNSLNLPQDRLSQATEFLSSLLTEVVLGQAMDLTFEKENRFTQEDVMLVHRYKTADYTIPGPLSLGAILAGVKEDDLKAVKDFGIPIGIAFQLKDDELGVFSNEEEIGKSVSSDIKEGKVTLLIVKAFELSKDEDKKFLQENYGKDNLTDDEIKKIRSIISSSGALSYSKSFSQELVEKGLKNLDYLKVKMEYKDLLKDIAEFVLERKS